MKFLTICMLLTSIGILSSCKEKTPPPPPTKQSATLSGEINGVRSLSEDTVYLLDGFVYVAEGGILKIPAGTILKGKSNSKACLIVERGGKIEAKGSQSKPIVFTSDKPKGQRNYGDWGGIILCGKAKINVNGGEAKVEGGPRSMYGGTEENDNSGILQYVRIEFGGIEFATDKEINGLTMCAVGNATTIDHIQVSYIKDDAYEWFGGNVNCRYLVAYKAWDDDFDTDNGFSGSVQFGVALRDPAASDKSKSNGFESDNDATGTDNSPLTNPKFSNISIYGPYSVKTDKDKTHADYAADAAYGPYQAAMHLRRNTRLQVYNSVFAGYPIGLFIDGDKAIASAQAGVNNSSNNLVLKNCVLSGMIANFKSTDSTFKISEYYLQTALGNRIITENSEMMLNNPFAQVGKPNFLPKTGSPLLTGANFSGLSGFNTVQFVGAFGSEDWTQSWCNFDPQNTDY